MRLIDADALEKTMRDRYDMLVKDYGQYDAYAEGYDEAITLIEATETADKSRFVELPCRVGDTIYHVDTYKGATVKENVVSEIRITDKGIAYFAMTEDGVFAFRSDAIGRDVFLTREEAEHKLEEMKK